MDAKLAIDVAGMGLDCVQREEEPGGDLGIGQPFGDELQDLELALAQWLDEGGRRTKDQRRSCGVRSSSLITRRVPKRGQQPLGVLWSDTPVDGFSKQPRHRRSLVHKGAHIAFRLGQG